MKYNKAIDTKKGCFFMPMVKSIKFNKKELEDKIYACWVGKNIGGTMGGPFEGVKEMHNIHREGNKTPLG